jgi:O-antigen/teichoic acid export membrane protein
LSFKRDCLKDGFDILKLGVAFVLAAAVGSGAEMFIRSYLNIEGGLSDVGLYNAGYMITITYAGMVFSAMETDYFPRLSGVANDIQATNETVNKQMEVSLLLLSPMLMALMVLLPVLIPVLFSMEFLSVIAMAQVAVLAMYFKVMTLPVAYITLARRRSLAFLLLESSYFVVLVIAVAVGYRQADIFGAGVGVVVAHVFDYLLINIFAYYRYDYRCTWPLMGYAVVQLSIACVAYWVTRNTDGVAYWMIETALTLVSTAYSITILHQKTRLWEALRKKLF